MKTSLKLLYTGIASLVAVTGFSVIPAIAELANFDRDNNSPDTVTGYPPATGGFPRWYAETSNRGLKLDLCVNAKNPLCLAAPPPNPNEPISFPDNFPDEAFWWTTEAETTTTPGGAKALLVLATEAAFANGDPVDGDQVTFNRTRIRVLGGLKPNVKYRITYPYGVKVLTATQKDPSKPATINFTEDFGCAVSPTTICDFGTLLVAKGRGTVTNPIGKPWLTWDTGSPAGYVGDPNVEHKITGSPFGTNFFRVQELNAAGTPVRQIAFTNLFSVSGKISTSTAPATTP